MIENTGFDFDRPADVPITPRAVRRDAAADAHVVAPKLAEVYPQFAKSVFGFEMANT